MDRILTPDLCAELSRLSSAATPAGATIGGIVHDRMARDFGRASASLDGETSSEVRARHAQAMRYIIEHRPEPSEQHLHELHQILNPGTGLDEDALTTALDRLPTGAHPFEGSITLLTLISLAPIPSAEALARAACNIPLRSRDLAPLLFLGVEHHFPGLAEYAAGGDTARLVQAYRIAYGTSCKRFGQYFYGL